MSTTVRPITFSITALSDDLAKHIRETLQDHFGNSQEVTKPGSVPCRSCLRITHPEASVIVFAHQPFAYGGPYAEVGPIFIHADPCSRYTETSVFPVDFRDRVLTMRGYNDERRIETAELSASGEHEISIARLFANNRVRFIHVRNPAWGCYDFQVDRC